MNIRKTLKPSFSILSLLMVFNIFGQNDIDVSPLELASPIEDNREVFKKVEQMPRFPGCENIWTSEAEIENCVNEKLLEFVHSNVSYPKAAKINKVEGMAVIQFVVDESGIVTNGEVLRDIKGYFEAPILAMLRTMPKWIPGKQGGKAVKVLYTFPVIFKLPRDNKSLKDQESDSGSSTNIVMEEVVKEFAPDFEMTMEDGSKKKLSDYKGQLVYLSFWASWCGPCIKGFKNYREMREDIEKLGVVMLNVSIDKDSEKWKAAIAEHQPTGIHAIVPHDEVRELYQLYNVPGYEIIGKNGQFFYLSDEVGRDVLENFKEFLNSK